MSVLKYLSAGKSLIGLKKTVVRYQMGEPGALPKFDSKRNPFRPRTNPPAQAATSPAPATTGQNDVPPRPEIQATTVTLVNSRGLVVPAVLIAPELAIEKPKAATSLKTAAKAAGTALRQSISRLGEVAGCSVHGIKTLARWRKRPERPVSHPIKTAVQCELSLDSVKVIRNDLSDADFEVVPRNRKPMVVGGGSEGRAVPSEPNAAMQALNAGRSPAKPDSESPLVEAGREG